MEHTRRPGPGPVFVLVLMLRLVLVHHSMRARGAAVRTSTIIVKNERRQWDSLTQLVIGRRLDAMEHLGRLGLVHPLVLVLILVLLLVLLLMFRLVLLLMFRLVLLLMLRLVLVHHSMRASGATVRTSTIIVKKKKMKGVNGILRLNW